MAQIISASIDVSKIDKSRLITGKNGNKYLSISILVNDNQDRFGNDVAITLGQTKEERQAKAEKVYIGNGRIVWRSQSQSKPAQSQTAQDDLPF